jgi:hypothetical protein
MYRYVAAGPLVRERHTHGRAVHLRHLDDRLGQQV